MSSSWIVHVFVEPDRAGFLVRDMFAPSVPTLAKKM
jgi:hypothetical protein